MRHDRSSLGRMAQHFERMHDEQDRDVRGGRMVASAAVFAAAVTLALVGVLAGAWIADVLIPTAAGHVIEAQNGGFY